jgi:hypothetical protein
MNSVHLTHREAERNLPMVCMACGARAVERRSHTFRWSPFMFWGGPGGYGYLVDVALNKFKAINVPLCEADRNYFWKPLRGWLIIAGIFLLLFMLSFAWAPFVIVLNWPAFIPFVWAIGAFLFLIPASICFTIHVRNTYVRAGHIDERGVTLVNVAPGFVRAMKRKRKAGEDDDDEEDFIRRDVSALGFLNNTLSPRRRRRRVENDYEDDEDDDEDDYERRR